mmetsp:Transcript_17158/g.32490  ORF Transcript_17158/g.32490 Transcript_17158/m.32490 type:complete len:244 (-) Transcript_17158:2418-3149(-)
MNTANGDRHENAHGITESKPKRRRTKENHRALYHEVAFTERKSTGRPASPHRFFSKSYSVTLSSHQDSNDFLNLESSREEQSTGPIENGQIVHQHANSLVIVTAGYLVRDELRKRQSQQLLNKQGDALKIQRFQFQQSVFNSQSVGGKRKRPPRTVNGVGDRDTPGMVRPSDNIAVVTFTDGSILDLKCCVAGTLLDINEKLSTSEDGAKQDGVIAGSSLLIEDPLLDGYLAVIMPTGFPCNV